jgi:hypothetical protein
MRTLASMVSIDRPPRPGLSELTEPIVRAICRWIDVSAPSGLEGLVAAYFYEETYATPMLALEQLEDRYGLADGQLRRSYTERIGVLIERQRHREVAAGSFTADLDDPVEILARVPRNEQCEVFLGCLPEPEFLIALEVYGRLLLNGARRRRTAQPDLFAYLEKVFRNNGLPLTASARDGIRWIGEPVIREHVSDPGLAALADSRLSNARKEFEDARRELRNGQLDDAANDAGCAVESTMAALLHAHGRRQPTKHGKDRVQAGPLFDALEAAGVVDRERDRHLIFGAIDVRDAGSHGAGISARRTDRAYVEAGVAASAIAISYLASKLP